MRDLYLDFGTFTIRIVETMPGEPDEILSEDTAAPESDFGVEIVDAEAVPGLTLHSPDRDAILIRELEARIAASVSRLISGTMRLCRECRSQYFFDVDSERFLHNGSPGHGDVVPLPADAEELLILAQLRDMINDVRVRSDLGIH